MGQHPIELVEPNDGADDAVTHHEVVRRGQSVPRWLALPAACVALLLVWLLVGPGDEEVETAGFVVAEAEALGYQIAAAFDDTNVAADGATSPDRSVADRGGVSGWSVWPSGCGARR